MVSSSPTFGQGKHGARIGLYGGTFDPIHVGHLIVASQAKHEHNLDAVWFMPTNDYGYEVSDAGAKKPTANAQQRLAMIDLAIGNREGFFTTNVECSKDGPIRTIDTIRELQKKYRKHDFFWICGADSYNDMPSWEEGEEILRLTKQIVAPRVYIDSDDSFGYGIYPEFSSTWVRKQLKKKGAVDFIVPEATLNYIKLNGLYT